MTEESGAKALMGVLERLVTVNSKQRADRNMMGLVY
jgi:hypothetical protein